MQGNFKFNDLTGKVFSRLTVLRRANNTQGKRIKFVCACVCGNETMVTSDNLLSGKTTSCGCIRGQKRAEQLKLEYGLASKRSLFRKYQDSAKRRNIVFELSFDSFIAITSANCYYCNRKPSSSTIHSRRAYGDYIYNGIDRVDNTKGYVDDNSVPCCPVCNRAKGNMSIDMFIEWIKAISGYLEVINHS